MPSNQFQRTVFAFLTVLVTVHAFVFYNLYVVNGATLMELNGTQGVLEAINKQGGVYMFGSYMPIWSVVLVEFIFAFSIITLFATWFKLVCFNLPFAFFGQVFFIQPLIRKVFKTIFCRNKIDTEPLAVQAIKAEN